MVSEANAPDPTEKPPERRKLIAVMYADMVGYSRLIGLDDAGTLDRLRTLRRNLIDPAIEEHGGRIVQTGGDSLLIVFDSIDGAVRCAMKVQQQVPVHDGEQPADRAIRFRIGINIGDAIAHGTDLHGHAVNVAARIQTECPPGGICVTRPVRDHVQDRLNLAFEELGALKLKNIARPVEAFVVRHDAGATMPQFAGRAGHEVLPLPDKPSIAVLAFTNMSQDRDQEFFADGIAEDIITDLSHNRLLFVIARNSSFTYQGQAVDTRRIAEELGVRYVVEGSVRRDSSRMRITAQLIDAETGRHIWAERYDRNLADIFEVQDQITQAIVQALGPAISQAERQRAIQRPPENLSAWEAYQRALSHRSKEEDNATAYSFLRRAVALDPRFAPPHAILASCYLSGASLGTRPLSESVRLAESEARIALELDAESAVAHAILAWIFGFHGDQASAFEEAETAITLNPSEPYGHLIKGRTLAFSGEPEAARESLTTALRLDPRGPTALGVMMHRTISSYLEGDYAVAEETARRTLRAYPTLPRPYGWRAAALGQLGRHDEARAALDATARPYLEFITGHRPPWFFRPQDHQLLLNGLRKAGWQG